LRRGRSSFVGSTVAEASYHGYTHFSSGTVGTDRFPDMETAAGAQGFTAPLGPGTYTFLIQQTGTAATSYGFNFNVIPEPGSFALLAGAALLTFRRGHGR
jgi:hypothetical protein